MPRQLYDVFTYNGEKDILDIHLNVLKENVDRFIIIEFDKTFSGKDKPYYFKLKEYEDFPIKYITFDESHYEKYRELAESSPNTVGASHWKREFMQKESIKDALVGLEDDDIVFIGDVDEIWYPGLPERQKRNQATVHGVDWTEFNNTPRKLFLRVYSYYLNNRSSEMFWGTILCRWEGLKDKVLNHVRSDARKELLGYDGWHFTSMGGLEEVKRKLSDSYTEESYWNPAVRAHLEENMAQNRDFLGRDFTYKIDESEWPQYLKNNREKYKHLLK